MTGDLDLATRLSSEPLPPPAFPTEFPRGSSKEPPRPVCVLLVLKQSGIDQGRRTVNLDPDHELAYPPASYTPRIRRVAIEPPQASQSLPDKYVSNLPPRIRAFPGVLFTPFTACPSQSPADLSTGQDRVPKTYRSPIRIGRHLALPGGGVWNQFPPFWKLAGKS